MELKPLIVLLIMSIGLAIVTANADFVKKNYPNGIYKFDLKLLDGKKLNLGGLKGRPLLLVNMATRCGFTGQLDDLEALYKKYKKGGQGLAIIGIPSNDFGRQTPEKGFAIGEFCRLKYGVTFPITEKIKIKGSEKSDIFRYLSLVRGNQEVRWNFEKFLFNKEGHFIGHFRSGEKPLNGNLESIIKNL